MAPKNSTNLRLMILASGALSTLAIATPSLAQLNVTGGSVTIDNAEVFVPVDGVVTGTTPLTNQPATSPDNRSVVYDGFLNTETLIIQTNQGNVPADALFRGSTLPVIDNLTGATFTGGAGLVGTTGSLDGTLSFRSIGPTGASFFSIPTTFEFQVAPTSALAIDPLNFTEFRSEGWILTETGFVTDVNGVGVVQRQQPVFLVQYQPEGVDAQSQLVLGNNVPASAYAAERLGVTYDLANLDLSFTGGIIETPPGFNLTGVASENRSDVIIASTIRSTSRVEAISVFNNVAIINLPFPDDVEYGDDDDDDDGQDDIGQDDDDDDDDISQGGGDDDDDDGDDDDDDGDIGQGGDDDDDSDDDDDGDDDDDDDDGDDDDDDDGGIVTNPNDGSTQFRPVFPRFIFVGVFVFNNVPSGRWFDPPAADGFEYEMVARDTPVGVASRVFPGMTGVGQSDDSVFTAISGFPTGIDADDTFTVAVDGVVLGDFTPGDTLRFSDYEEMLGDRLTRGGVRKFTISGIDPAVDSTNPVAFPLRLDFNTNTASFEMRALEATGEFDETQVSSTSLEP